MKPQISSSCNQQGFTLLESLVAVLLFSIVILGSGAAIARMLNIQKEMHVNFIVTNLMQTRLQSAAMHDQDVCHTIDQSNFKVADTTYFVACSTENIAVSSTQITWPILAVSSKNLATARACATATTADADCYVVGR